MSITLVKPRLMRWNNNAITDHNRADLQKSYTRIGNQQRMANGMMRTYYIADKRKFTVSWDELPGNTVNTVDGFWGADDMEQFYLNNYSSFTLELTFADGIVETYSVVFTDFSKDLKKRGFDDFFAVDVSMEEV